MFSNIQKTQLRRATKTTNIETRARNVKKGLRDSSYHKNNSEECVQNFNGRKNNSPAKLPELFANAGTCILFPEFFDFEAPSTPH